MKTRSGTWLGILLAVMVLGAGEAFSAEEKEVTLEAVEVVATPIIEGNWVSDFANRITTVTDRQIEDLNALDFQSALRRVPGVLITRYNLVGSYGGGTGGSIFIRGMGSERPGAEIQTLVDGRPSFVGMWTHPLMDIVGVNQTDHIDVYKGAQPVLFGNMAYGAVNATTKRITEEGFVTRIVSAYGSYRTFNEWLETGGKKGPFDYYLSGTFLQSDGHRENADGQNQNYFGRVGYRPSANWDISLTGNYVSSYADDPGSFLGPFYPVTTRFQVRDRVLDLTVSNQYRAADGLVKIYFDSGQIRWKDQWDTGQKVAFDTNTDWSNYGFRAQEKLRPWPGGEIVLGYDYDVYGGEAEEIPPSRTKQLEETHFYNSAPYVWLKHTFGEELRITPSVGVRYNMSKYFGDIWGPQAGLVAQCKDTTVYAQYARGFNLPGVYVVFFYTLNFNKGDQWKNLEPETMDHFEFGVSQKFTKWLKADAAVFYDAGNNRLIFKAPPPRFENLESYRTRGLELTFTVTPLPNLEFFVGGTYLSPDPYDLPYAPRLTASGGLSYSYRDKIFFNLDSQYVSSRYTSNPRFPTTNLSKLDPYYLVNGRIAYRFKGAPGKWDGEVYVAGENLTNVNYEYLGGYSMPGITVLGGVSLKFWY